VILSSLASRPICRTLDVCPLYATCARYVGNGVFVFLLDVQRVCVDVNTPGHVACQAKRQKHRCQRNAHMWRRGDTHQGYDIWAAKLSWIGSQHTGRKMMFSTISQCLLCFWNLEVNFCSYFIVSIVIFKPWGHVLLLFRNVYCVFQALRSILLLFHNVYCEFQILR
jgi:hypothetical protein